MSRAIDNGPSQGGAVLIAFPQGKRIGQARITASVIDRCKREETRRAALSRAAAVLSAKLERAGIGDAEAARQVAAFVRAVHVEVARLQHERRQA